MELAVAHAALADRLVRQRPHRLDGTAQHRHFQAGIVIEMDVKRRDLQVVMLVLRSGKTLAELSRLVIVDIGQRRNAEALGLAVASELLAGLDVAQDVAQRLRAAGIAPRSHVPVERIDEVVVDRKGYALHRSSTCLAGRQYALFSISAYEASPL